MLLKVNPDVESIYPFASSLSKVLDYPSTCLNHDLIVQRPSSGLRNLLPHLDQIGQKSLNCAQILNQKTSSCRNATHAIASASKTLYIATKLERPTGHIEQIRQLQ